MISARFTAMAVSVFRDAALFGALLACGAFVGGVVYLLASVTP